MRGTQRRYSERHSIDIQKAATLSVWCVAASLKKAALVPGSDSAQGAAEQGGVHSLCRRSLSRNSAPWSGQWGRFLESLGRGAVIGVWGEVFLCVVWRSISAVLESGGLRSTMRSKIAETLAAPPMRVRPIPNCPGMAPNFRF